MVWDQTTEYLLSELWAEGKTASEIGKQLGVTRNAVIGRAHKLKLPARPSPIKVSPGLKLDKLTRHMCCWPTGDIRSDEGLRFCGVTVKEGFSYCTEHVAIAYRTKGS